MIDPRHFNPNMITDAMKQNCKTVFLTMAYTETIRPIVEGYQKEILNFFEWKIDKQWVEKGMEDQIIRDPDKAYLLSDEDFKSYLAHCNIARKKANLHVDNPEFCPLLVAESLQNDAERLFIDSMEPITGLKAKDIILLKHRKQLLDICLRLVVRFVTKVSLI